ncbi:putative C2 domain, synaptotagmin-like mitochondrial-lipid-binding domain-containing protein [Rosa chinensis]|uniref:Putative C2 domain, synaptotagmin-like mitochondrial-lipid-binding domain-containing protein n=1 Tax=Rosa chinensis TaxID=74649 RepID=A0A2P6PXP9_ROSCH|nr:putative C2 domain, synaptotagmin-like mitochondrial-lipid-binding domain-containing protein [Rosa chinensis]
MGFFFGLLVGIAIGIGLIMAFARSESRRSKRRSELAKTIAALARMTVQDSRKLLAPQYYPSWLTWLNQHLDKIWPYVNEAASELIRSNVEPILKQYTPAVLDSLKFSTLTLGTVAPQFTGISLVESECGAGGVTMEFEIQWDGDPDIVIDINTRVGLALPVQVKDIGFTGVFRLIFKPLIDQFPCFGAVAYSLREKKKLDFVFKVSGSEISAIPGVSEALEETIRDAIEDCITWPVRNIIPIVPGDYSDLELKPVGTLEVKLVEAKELTNKDIVGKSDPFAVIFIRPLPDRTKTSKVIDNDLNPIWNEHYEFIVEDQSTQRLTVRIFDDEGLQAAEFIGCCQIPLSSLEPGKVKDVWLKLLKDLEIQRDTKYRGQVHLELLYCPYGTDGNIVNPFDHDFSLTSLEKALKIENLTKAELRKISTKKKKEMFIRGVLSVTVISAEDLPIVDFMGKADPYVVLVLKKSEAKQKTRVITNNLNPVWNQTFDFMVEDALHEMLIVEVWDHDTFGKDRIGRVIMTLTRVLMEGEYQECYPIDIAKSGRITLTLKWVAQHKVRDS